LPNTSINKGNLTASDSLRLHWPEYLMEGGEAGIYLFSACVVATFLWHPASPVQGYLPNDAVRRMLMGLAMDATIMAIVLSPGGKQGFEQETAGCVTLSEAARCFPLSPSGCIVFDFP